MKLIATIFAASMLVACGGGSEPPVAVASIGYPTAAMKSAKVPGGGGVAVHVYQALYGMAPSNAMLTDYTAQATADPSAFARNLTANFAGTSDTALALLVLNNLNITATSVNATSYSILLDALGQMFAGYGAASRGQIILNATNLLTNLESDATYGQAAASYNNQAYVNYTYAANTGSTSPAAVPILGANAGLAQTVTTGTIVRLDAGASTADVGRTLTYAWTLTSKPAGSTSALSSATSIAPTFKADLAGTYVVSLTVNDGMVSSAAVTNTVTVVPRISGALGISANDNYFDFCGINGQFTTVASYGAGTWTISNCKVYGTAGSPLVARLRNNGSTDLTLTRIHIMTGMFGNAWGINPSSQVISPGISVDFALPLWLGLEVTNAVATFTFTGEPDFVVQLKGSMVSP